MKKKALLKLSTLAIILILISYIVLLIFGRTYTMSYKIYNNNKIDELKVYSSNEKIIKITDKKIDNNILLIKIKSLKKGKAYIYVEDMKNPDYNQFHTIYVHHGGIITFNEFLGQTRGNIILIISLIVFIMAVFITLLKIYVKSVKKNLYQYKNVFYLGALVFLGVYILILFSRISHNFSIMDILNSLDSSATLLSYVFLPVAFITSILVTLSNFRLLIKEGKTWKNMLGTILGLLFIFITILPEKLYSLTYYSSFIDIHNSRSIWCYLYMFVESTIYLVASYLECILISSIFHSIKAAKHIPKLNKDYIIILGCQIRKDGTLTPLLKSRVDRAIEFANMQRKIKGKDIVFIPSGGKGADEVISEAEAMKNYLLEQGISKKNILVEDKSTNTYENMQFSYKLVKNKKANLAFSTTNYHVFRSGVIAYNQNIEVEGIGSKTKRYFWINAFIREFIATIYSEKKKHIIVFTFLVLFYFIINMLLYIANIL